MKTYFLLLLVTLASLKQNAQCPATTYIGVSNITSTQATLTWNSVGAALSYSSGYRVLGSTTWLFQGGPLGLSTTQTLAGLIPSTTYQFFVQTACAGLTTSPLFITTFTTAPTCVAPSGLSVTGILYTQATVNWTAVPGAQSYRVEYKLSSGSSWTAAVTATTSLSYSLSGLISASIYDVRVRTNCAGGQTSAYASTSFSTLAIPCTQPYSLMASSITTSQASLSWQGGVGPLSYTLEYKAASSSNWIILASMSSATSYLLNGLSASTLYDYRVKSHCASTVSGYAQSQFTTASAPCATPTGLSASGITSNGATVNWGSVSGASSYQLEFKPSTTTLWLPVVAATAATTYTWASGLTASTTYEYRVKADCSPSFAQGQFTTMPPPCSAPGGLAATAITSTSATLQWSAVAGAMSYEVMYTDNPLLGIWSLLPSTTSTSSNLNGLSPSTLYTFAVRTNCGSSSSLYTQAQFTTLALPCQTPLNLTTTAIGGTDATFNWDPVPGVTQYNVRYAPVMGAITMWTNLSTGNSSISVAGLQYGAFYEWQVQAVCSVGVLSSFTNSIFFTTNSCTNLPGRSMSNAIIVGQVPCSGSVYSNTQYNSVSNCFSDNLISVDNQQSPDIWYQFTLSSPETIEISHCANLSAATNTYLHLLNSAGIQVASNDDNGPLCAGNKASLSVTLSAGTYYVVSELSGSGNGTITTSINTNSPCNAVLNVKLFLEGYYSGAQMMAPVLLNQGYSGLPAPTLLDVDDIEIELRNSTPPYAVVTSVITRLQTNGLAVCTFPPLTGSYYLVVKHRNTVKTWSSAPVSLSGSSKSYNFSNFASKAYGNNMVEVEPGVWALYTGDMNQDENVDLPDLNMVEADIAAYQYGYKTTDTNGDGNVDLLDSPIVEANVNSFIFSSHP